MAANETKLGVLHDAVADALTTLIAGTRTEDYIDPETEELVEGTVIPPSAAIITAAAKFLKDNNITCEPSSDNGIGELERIMIDRQNRLRGNSLDKADLAGITADAGFMGSA